jgi:hypothetical protein
MYEIYRTGKGYHPECHRAGIMKGRICSAVNKAENMIYCAGSFAVYPADSEALLVSSTRSDAASLPPTGFKHRQTASRYAVNEPCLPGERIHFNGYAETCNGIEQTLGVDESDADIAAFRPAKPESCPNRTVNAHGSAWIPGGHRVCYYKLLGT